MQITFGHPVLRSQARARFAFHNTASHATSCPQLWRHDPNSTFRWGHAGRLVQPGLSATADASAEAEDVMASVYEFDHEEEVVVCQASPLQFEECPHHQRACSLLDTQLFLLSGRILHARAGHSARQRRRPLHDYIYAGQETLDALMLSGYNAYCSAENSPICRLRTTLDCSEWWRGC